MSKRWTCSSTGCANIIWHDSRLLYWPSVVLVAAHATAAAKLEEHTQLVARSNTHGPVALPSRRGGGGGDGGEGGEGGGEGGEGGGGGDSGEGGEGGDQGGGKGDGGDESPEPISPEPKPGSPGGDGLGGDGGDRQAQMGFELPWGAPVAWVLK